jgi:PIN domain nuclease of toxin-antitoxin system
MRLLLDTCTFLWLITDAADLSPLARDLFASPENEIFLSTVSAWEIVLKHSLGSLPLPESPQRFIPDQREKHGIETLSLDEDSTLQWQRLPQLHNDPFDRMLICQAISQGLTILTPDSLIGQYPIRVLW